MQPMPTAIVCTAGSGRGTEGAAKVSMGSRQLRSSCDVTPNAAACLR